MIPGSSLRLGEMEVPRRGRWAPLTHWNQNAVQIKYPGQGIKGAPPVERSDQFVSGGRELGAARISLAPSYAW